MQRSCFAPPQWAHAKHAAENGYPEDETFESTPKRLIRRPHIWELLHPAFAEGDPLDEPADGKDGHRTFP